MDFDFFGSRSVDPLIFTESVLFLTGARVVQREPNTPTALVDRGGPVMVSFFGVPALKRVARPDVAASNHLRVASLLDLAGTKAAVVQLRSEARDYLDIDALTGAGIGLDQALGAAQAIYGTSFNPQITLKALSWFDDGNLSQLPPAVKERLARAARETDLDRLPAFTALGGL